MKTKLTELLGIQYPILQGAMAWTSEHKLVAAVAEAGCAGAIASGGRDAAWLRNEIQGVRKLTDKPFGVNLMLMAKNIDELLEVILEEKPTFVTLGAGNPVPFIEPLHAAGIKVIPLIPNAKLAKRVAEKGADAIVIEGQEAGGHIGKLGTMALAENVIPEVDIPVVLAGGIVDGRGLAAALVMGAEGIQMGTRFIMTEECQMHENCKEVIKNASDTDSVVTGLTSGHGGVRGIKNDFTDRYLALEFSCGDKDELTKMSIGTNKLAAVDGDVVNGLVQAGQGLNRLTQVTTVKEAVDSIIKEAKEALKRGSSFC